MLTVNIDRRWEPEDFIEFFRSVESLYYKAIDDRRHHFLHDYLFFERRFERGFGYLSYDEHLDAMNERLLKENRNSLQSDSRISVFRIAYASPGPVDIAGLGTAMEAIDKIIGRLITFFTERNLRKEGDKRAGIETELKAIELEKEKESLRSLKIANAREILALEREYPEEIQLTLVQLAVRDQDKLAALISEGKLIGSKVRKDK